MKKLSVLIITLVTMVFFVSCDSGDEGPTIEEFTVGKDVVEKDVTESKPDVTEGIEEKKTCEPKCPYIGTKECVGTDGYHECKIIDGCPAWSSKVPCNADEECKEGDCVKKTIPCDPAKSCTTIGEKKCKDKTVMECQKIGECQEFVEKETCMGTDICQNGDCVPQSTGTLSCKDMITCFNGCGSNNTCMQNCYAQGSPEGQTAFTNLSTCIDTNCGEIDPNTQPGSSQKCIFEKCKAEYEGCMGPFGTKTCSETLQCAQGCGQNQSCVQNCMNNASYEAMIQMLDIYVCIETKCKGITDQNQLQTCISTNCMTEVMNCLY